MRKLVLTGLVLAAVAPVALPAAAAAQSRAEVRDSARDYREERRELAAAYRSGDPRDIREERRDVASAHKELHDDWRDYRRAHPRDFARGHYDAPFRYHRWSHGAYVRPAYYAPRYVIAHPGRYRLPEAGRHMRYVRHYDDVLLINTRTGRVVDVYRGFFW